MKKWLLTMILAVLMLAGCGNGADADKDNDNNDNDVVENTDMDYEDDYEDDYDDYEDDFEDDYEEEEIEGAMDFTLYNGDVVTIYEDRRTLVSLANADQLIAIDTIEVVFPQGQKITFPAENVPAAIDGYDTLVVPDAYEEEESYAYGDTLRAWRSWFKNEEQFVYFTMDNATAAEDVDLLTLPVTEMWVVLDEGNVTVNGYEFVRNTFVITDLIAAWGDPFCMEVDDKSTREEGDDYDYEYYWRFNNGYICVDLEEGKLENLYLVQWDTYACEDDNLWGIPKYGEE